MSAENEVTNELHELNERTIDPLPTKAELNEPGLAREWLNEAGELKFACERERDRLNVCQFEIN